MILDTTNNVFKKLKSTKYDVTICLKYILIIYRWKALAYEIPIFGCEVITTSQSLCIFSNPKTLIKDYYY